MYVRAGFGARTVRGGARGRGVLSRRPRNVEAELVEHALRRGLRYERLLTDMVLQLRHPERRGAPPRRDEAELLREWRTIRDQLVRPRLHRTAPPAAATPRRRRLGSPLGQTGRLRSFRPDEVVLNDEEARAVLRFFWPDKDELRVMTVTAADRAFAQALLLEAVDATLTMGVVEELYRRFFGRVASGFGSIAVSVLRVVRRAVRSQWLRTSKTLDASKVRIYENVRVTMARNYRSVLETRLLTGEPTY